MIGDHYFDNMLFRYRSFNPDTLDAFKSNRLYFSTPYYFNDPFDSVMYINEDRLIGSILRDLDEGMKDYLGAKEFTGIISKQHTKGALNLSKSLEIRGAFLDKVLTYLDNIKNNVLENAKVICFSKCYLSILMWSHYADNHTGFVLGYLNDDLKKATIYDENDNNISSRLQIAPVCYQINMPDYGEFFYEYYPEVPFGGSCFNQTKLLTQLLYNKTSEWGYEEEWRLCSIRKDYTYPDDAKYLSVRPTALFLGAKMSNKHKWEMYCIAKKLDIAVFELWTNTLSPQFKLNFQKVNPKLLKALADNEK